MNIALVDDREADRVLLEQTLREYAAINGLELSVTHYSCGEALLSEYHPFKFSVLFLDIYMDGMTGIQTAERIRELDDDAILIFLTTSEAHMSEAFSVFASAYLQKPCQRDRVFRTLDHVLRRKTEAGGFFTFPCGRKTASLRFSDIVCLETEGNYLFVLDVRGVQYRTRMTFSTAERMLDNRFLTLMKGIVVNMDYILQISGSRCTLQSGRVLPLQVKKQRELQEKWLNYKFARIRSGSPAFGGDTGC